MSRLFRLGLACCALVAGRSAAFAALERACERISDGVELVTFADRECPLHAFLLKADLSAPGLRFDVQNGADALCELCPVSKMAGVLARKTGRRVLAGVNGDFCQYSANPFARLPYVGRTCRMSVSGGELMQTGYETPPGQYDVLYATTDGKVRFGGVGFAGTVTLGEETLSVDHVNTMPLYLPEDPARRPAVAAVFTSRWPRGVPADGILVRLDGPPKGTDGAAVARTFTVTGRLAKGEKLPAGDARVAAIVGFGAAARTVSSAVGSGKLAWSFPGAEGPVRDLVGVWNRPLRAGKVVETHEAKDYPRTAIGLDTVRNRLCLFVCDGRQGGWSRAFPSREMAALLQREGCDEVGQFDGGGSSVLWLDGRGIVNRPSDFTGERALGSGLFLSLPR